MKSPKISIIVPVYKVERYLVECIDSVLAQTYKDYELLLVDDGSPDRCGEICDDFAATNPRIKALHKKNGGLSSARNYGMERARGKWIIFLDSDDVWGDKDGLRRLMEYAEKFDLDILRFEYQAIDERGNKIYPRPFKEKDLPQGAISNYEMVSKAIAGEWFAWLYLLRMDVIGALRFDETCHFQEDIDFYSKLFAVKEMRCGYLADKIYSYRKREASLTTRTNINNLKGSFNLCNVFYAQSKVTHDDQLRQLYLYNAVMMYYWTLCTLSEDPYFASHKEIIEELKLNELHEQTSKRMQEVSIPAIYKPFLTPRPSIGVRLLHAKNKAVVTLHNILSQ